MINQRVHHHVNHQLTNRRLLYWVKFVDIIINVKACLNGFNSWLTFIQQKLNECWANVGWTEWSNGFNAIYNNTFKNKGSVETTMNGTLNQFKIDSTHFQQAFNIFLHFQRCWTTFSNAPDIQFSKVLNACWSKMFQRALTLIEWPLFSEKLNNDKSECAS